MRVIQARPPRRTSANGCCQDQEEKGSRKGRKKEKKDKKEEGRERLLHWLLLLLLLDDSIPKVGQNHRQGLQGRETQLPCPYPTREKPARLWSNPGGLGGGRRVISGYLGGCDVWAVSETHLTSRGFRVGGAPVPLRPHSDRSGEWSGVAMLSKHPTRQLPVNGHSKPCKHRGFLSRRPCVLTFGLHCRGGSIRGTPWSTTSRCAAKHGSHGTWRVRPLQQCWWATIFCWWL